MIEPDPRIAELKGGAKQAAIRDRSRVHQNKRAKLEAATKGHRQTRLKALEARARAALRAKDESYYQDWNGPPPFDQEAAKEARRLARNRKRRRKP